MSRRQKGGKVLACSLFLFSFSKGGIHLIAQSLWYTVMITTGYGRLTSRLKQTKSAGECVLLFSAIYHLIGNGTGWKPSKDTHADTHKQKCTDDSNICVLKSINFFINIQGPTVSEHQSTVYGQSALISKQNSFKSDKSIRSLGEEVYCSFALMALTGRAGGQAATT